MRPQVFCLSNEDLASAPYHYTTCGLDGVYLLNGYDRYEHDGEEHIAIADVEGLHREIGRHLVLHRKVLAPAEIKFLRKTMDLTQAELASKLGNDVQSVARWEKGSFAMPGAAEKLLRAIYLAQNGDGEEDLKILRSLLVSIMDDMDRLDEHNPPQTRFELAERWIKAPPQAA